ncbi:MAG: hypothetical protein HRT58_18275 [Crocinitomicaceae bacterium]|nr:hypothetical protein [Flavobacteriales bacterium]NQZ37618.1 hypothetical protein [Crocinitomicaceae bacterium]
MLKVIVSFIFLLATLYASSQRVTSLYSDREQAQHIKSIKKIYHLKKIGELSLPKLNSVLSELVYNGDAIHDSIAKLRIYRSYYWSNSDLINGLKSRIKLLSYYSDNLTKEEIGSAQMKVGQSYYKLKDYQLSLSFYEKAETNIALDEKRLLFRYYGLVYLKLKKNTLALASFESSKKLSNKAVDLLNATNSLGFVKFLNNDFKGAEESYYQALKIFSANNSKIDSLQFAVIQGNIASLEIKTGNLEAGTERLLNIVNADFFKSIGNFQRQETFMKCIRAFLMRKDCLNAKKYLALYGKTLNLKKKKPSSVRLIYFELKTGCHNLCGESTLSKLAFKDYLNESNKLTTLELKLSNSAGTITSTLYEDQISLVDSNLKLEKKSRKDLKVSNARLTMLFTVSSILFLVFSGLLFLWFIQKRKGQKKNDALLKLKADLLVEKKMSHDLEKQMVEKEQENRKLEMTQILNEIRDNSSLSEEVTNRLQQMKKKGGDVQSDISQLLEFIKTINRNEEFNKLIEEKSDILRSGFREKIDAEFSQLSKSETQLLILIRLGLSTKEIAQFKNAEATSIRTLKYRLKVKMNIPRELELFDFIKNL